MRKLISISLAFAIVLSSVGAASAICLGTFDREVVGQIADVFFVAGVPETRTLNPFYSVRVPDLFNNFTPVYECGAMARSTLAGVTLIESYGVPGTPYPPGDWAGVSVSAGPGTYQYASGFQIKYDGSGAAGKRGTIEIAVKQSELEAAPRLIAIVNVYIVAPGTHPTTWFTVTSKAPQISGDRLILDHQFLNGQPAALAFVSHVRNPGGSTSGVFWNHPLALVYDGNLRRWAIRNDDGADMVVGVSFNVRIDPSAIRITVRGQRGQHFPFLRISQSAANYNRFATIIVTPAGDIRNPHPIAVRYLAPYWEIVNSDGADILAGASFNVKVMGVTSYIDDTYRGAHPFDPLQSNARSNGVGIDIDGIGVLRNSLANRYLSFFWSLRKPGLQIIVTPNLNPLGKNLVTDPHYVGVAYTGIGDKPTGHWSVFHEDQVAMPPNARFNVWAPPLASQARVGDTDGVSRP